MTRSKFEVLVPTNDPALLTLEEMRAAFPDQATWSDQQLTDLSLEASEWVASVCDVRTANSYPPTFKAEGIRETFIGLWGCGPSLVLGRKFLSDVLVTENGMALVEGSDFVVQDAAGIIERVVAAGGYAFWWGVPVIIDYVAGFGAGSPASAIPGVLKAAVLDYSRLRSSELSLDPMVRSETTVDLDSVTYGSAAGSNVDPLSALESATRRRLSRYMTGNLG
jgi:hypothetical protein